MARFDTTRWDLGYCTCERYVRVVPDGVAVPTVLQAPENGAACARRTLGCACVRVLRGAAREPLRAIA